MKTKSLFALLIAMSVVLLNGCGQTNPKQNKSAEMNQNQAELSVGQVEILPEAIRFNNQIKVPATNKDGFSKVKIMDVYYSALGKQCIAVQDELKAATVYCEIQNNIYQPYPSLSK